MEMALEDRAQTAIISLRRILKATDANVRAIARDAGLTTSQLIVLQLLRGRGEMLAGEIARSMELKQATISILLDRLQEIGMISRQRGEGDRRQVWVRLTAAGLQAVNAAPDLLQDRFRARFSKLPEWEQAGLIASLLRIVSLLDAEGIDASPLLDVGPVNALREDDDGKDGDGNDGGAKADNAKADNAKDGGQTS